MLDFPKIERKKPKARYIKPESVKRLESDYLDYKQRKYPNQPYLSKKTFRDDTANGLTKCIQGWCVVNGAHFQRMNTTGQYDAKLKRYRRSGATKGVTDTMIAYKGKTLNIEVKTGKDRQSEAQKQIQQSIETAGGIYWIVKDYEHFISKINEL